MSNFETLSQHIKNQAQKFLELNLEEVVLLHHNDADGLSSATILISAIERLGIKVRNFCLERLYSKVLISIFDNCLDRARTGLIVADFGSGLLNNLVGLNQYQLPIFVIDHHTFVDVPQSINFINCLQFSIPSLPNCSASALAALFALALDPANSDLTAAGVLGALGDGLVDPNGNLVSVNAEVFKIAQSQGLLEKNQAQYFFKRWSNLESRHLVQLVNALGSLAYFDLGPDIAIKGLREDFNHTVQVKAQSYLSQFDTLMRNFADSSLLKTQGRLSWFVLPEAFEKFGVKTVGLVCEYLLQQQILPAANYVLGIQKVKDFIPGLGDIELKQFKASMRLGTELYSLVQNAEASSLELVMRQAVSVVGGEFDACHPHAAACTFEFSMLEDFVRKVGQVVNNVAQ